MSVEVVTGFCLGALLLFLMIKLVIGLVGKQRTNSPSLPPFPGMTLPILGHLYMLKSNPRRQFLEWGQRYGPLVSLYLGNRLAVVLYGFDTIKEAFVTHADIFSNRPRTFAMQKLGKDRGFVTSTSSWKAQRKITIKILRDLGLGTSVMEEKIQNEISHYLAYVDRQHGAAFDPRQQTMQSISNIISVLVFGKNFSHDDPETSRCASLLGDQISTIEGTAILNFLPFLRYLPGDVFGLNKALHIAQSIEEGLIKKQLELRKMALEKQETRDTQDFISMYLREIRALKADGIKDSSINEENLVAVIANLFAAGTETTSTTICWALLYFLHFPEVMERCFQEIVAHVGLNRRATFQDRMQLKYVEATVMEIQRITSIAPFSLHHTVSSDFVFRNYFIPKGTIIMPSLDSVHFSTEIWEDPDNFRPERFLDDTGQTIVKREELIPFSIGRRSCVGEALAKMELFLFLSVLIQKYHIRVPEGEPVPPILDKFGLSCSPLPYKICLVLRSNVSA